jgi:hypothetical protein
MSSRFAKNTRVHKRVSALEEKNLTADLVQQSEQLCQRGCERHLNSNDHDAGAELT